MDTSSFVCMTSKSIVLGIVAFTFVVFPTSIAFAKTVPKNLAPELSAWSTYGTASIKDQNVTLTGGYSGWVYTDINVEKMRGSYLVLASHAKKSDSRKTSVDASRSGNPYIYGYLMNSKKKIKNYVTGDTRTTDNVIYTIVPVGSEIKTLRMFLKQSSVKDISNKGANVTFSNPVIYSAESEKEAKKLIAVYSQGTL